MKEKVKLIEESDKLKSVVKKSKANERKNELAVEGFSKMSNTPKLTKTLRRTVSNDTTQAIKIGTVKTKKEVVIGKNKMQVNEWVRFWEQSSLGKELKRSENPACNTEKMRKSSKSSLLLPNRVESSKQFVLTATTTEYDE